jgi:hypothetical protein
MGVRRVGVERCKQEGIIKYTAVGFWEYTFGMGEIQCILDWN